MYNIDVREGISVKTIDALKDDILSAFEKNSEIVLNFENVKRIDLAVLQLLIAGMKEAKKNGKTLKLKNISDNVKIALRICNLAK